MGTTKTSDGPMLLSAEPMQQMLDYTPRARSRWIIPPSKDGWDDFVLSEWELTASGFSDLHGHVEVNLVVEGELHVEANGLEVIARPGDTVCTPANSIGRYWAPTHARMIAIYGRNPDAVEEEYLKYWEISNDGESASASSDEEK